MNIKSVKYHEKERILSAALIKAKPLASLQEFSGSAPAPFVGRFGYPHVNVGILSATQHEDNAWEYDAPRHWAAEHKTIREIVHFRTSMINNRFTTNVKRPDKHIDIAQDVAMSRKTVDIDVELTKKPRLGLTTNQWFAPMGPQAQLKKLTLTTNPHIPTKVQKFYDDTDALASEALTTLYSKGVDENALSRMLSVGVFGKQRKLVPTRWSITATDDTLSKDLLENIRHYPLYDYKAYFGSYLGNYYLLLFFPEPWSYELFEMYATPGPTLEYSTDHEGYGGRKHYAENCAGGYYTVKLGIAEHLNALKRQASCLALRFITDEYVMPLGVWVTREATRNTLANKPITFASKELLLTYARTLAKKKFGIDLSKILNTSIVLKQKKLQEFI